MQLKEENYTWHLIDNLCNSMLINNEIHLVKVTDKEICILKYDDNIVAFSNNCPHAGAKFNNGGYIDLKGCVVCPLHGYRFDTKNVMSKTGDGYRLFCYKIKANKDEIWVGIKIS